MFDDDRSRFRKFLHQAPGSLQIHQVVVGKLLALELRSRRQAPSGRSGIAIKRGFLMGILPIPQIHHFPVIQVERLRKFSIGHFLQGGGDGTVISRRRRERFARQPGTRFPRNASAISLEFFQDPGIIGGVHKNRDILEIFRGRAQHRGTANVDVLDQLFQGHAGLHRGFFEGIKIHHHHVDELDPVFLYLRLVLRV